MKSIDIAVAKFATLPISLESVVDTIEVAHDCRGDLRRYVEYLLDDSIIPPTVAESFKPGSIKNTTHWESIVPHFKSMLFRAGASDHLDRRLLDGYSENEFDRIDALRKEQYAALRLQIKDEIVKELVRAYIEGALAAGMLPQGAGGGELLRLGEEYERNGCVNQRVKATLYPAASSPLITFLMLVTDRDILIADYCVKSFSLVRDMDFRLAVFCNWITPANRAKYFPAWRRAFPFVDIIEPDWMTEERRPGGVSGYGYGLEGPYERCEVPWDRELPTFKSRFCATVDADFEVLHPQFLQAMIEQMSGSMTAGFMATDRFEKGNFTYPGWYDTVLNARANTWCCIYRREALSCKVSHLYYQEPDEPTPDAPNPNAWDSSGLKQMAMRLIHGYREALLAPGFWPHFIHYGAFSKNKNLDATNVATYRMLSILRKIGYEQILGSTSHREHQLRLTNFLMPTGIRITGSEDVARLAAIAYEHYFGQVDRTNPEKNCKLAPVNEPYAGRVAGQSGKEV